MSTPGGRGWHGPQHARGPRESAPRPLPVRPQRGAAIGDDAEALATGGGRTTVRDVVVDAAARLARAGVESASSDAAAMVAHVLGVPRTGLLLHDKVDDGQRVRVEALLVRRVARVPLQHLLGTAGFRTLELQVGPGVFVPRPETEVVAGAALSAVPGPGAVVVDLCTGSGALALAVAVERAGVHVHAVERDDSALAWARRNLDDCRSRVDAAGSTVVLHHADAATCAQPGQPLSALAGGVDVVVANPPYIPDGAVPRDPEVRDHDPAAALFGGPDGLDVVRRVARTAAVLLRPGGTLVVEHADAQGEDAGAAGVPGLLRAAVADDDLALEQATPAGSRLWADVRDLRDLADRPRVTLARRT